MPKREERYLVMGEHTLKYSKISENREVNSIREGTTFDNSSYSIQLAKNPKDMSDICFTIIGVYS